MRADFIDERSRLKGVCSAYSNAIKDARRIKRGTKLPPAGRLRQKLRDEMHELADPLIRLSALAKERGDTVQVFDGSSGKLVAGATKTKSGYVFRFPRY